MAAFDARPSTRCPMCGRNAASHGCNFIAETGGGGGPQWLCVNHGTDGRIWREWSRRTNRSEAASTLDATPVTDVFNPYWPWPTDDEDELEGWIVRTTTQYWCVGIRWGAELCQGAP